jgi:peptidyl-prolyl cis-trans isomerase C
MMPTATARHILVPTAQQAEDIKAQIAAGADFAEMARAHSTCPSGARGGDLGEFSPGQMVKEFNDVCFNEAVGVVHGPVQTQFGFHLIEVTDRRD